MPCSHLDKVYVPGCAKWARLRRLPNVERNATTASSLWSRVHVGRPSAALPFAKQDAETTSVKEQRTPL
jgi:hypothetical protein